MNQGWFCERLMNYDESRLILWKADELWSGWFNKFWNLMARLILEFLNWLRLILELLELGWFWKVELLMDWCLRHLNCDDMSNCWISDCIIEVCKFEFNFEWDEGYDKVYWKILYLSDLISISDDLKFIGKFFQRSTTSFLMTSSNSNDFEGELRFEFEKFCFKIFLKLFAFYCGNVSGSRHWVCWLQSSCQL